MFDVPLILAALGGFLTAGVPLYIKYRQQTADNHKRDLFDAEAHWSAIIARLNEEITRLQGRITEQEDKIEQLRQHHRDCEVKSAEMRVTLAHLEKRIADMAAGGCGLTRCEIHKPKE